MCHLQPTSEISLLSFKPTSLSGRFVLHMCGFNAITCRFWGIIFQLMNMLSISNITPDILVMPLKAFMCILSLTWPFLLKVMFHEDFSLNFIRTDFLRSTLAFWTDPRKMFALKTGVSPPKELVFLRHLSFRHKKNCPHIAVCILFLASWYVLELPFAATTDRIYYLCS